MNLYKSYDYKNVSKEDLLEYEKIRNSEFISPGEREIIGRLRKNKFHEYPKSVRHYNSLFPNNYLDTLELKKEVEIHSMIEAFEELLHSSPNEQEILSFINGNENYLIIASIFKHYNFGHHEAYLFKEFQLNTQYRADYLLVGKGSGGYEFIFIELEHPSNNPFKNNGTELSQCYQNGINQVKSWERFLEQQFSSLQPKFNEAKKMVKVFLLNLLITIVHVDIMWLLLEEENIMNKILTIHILLEDTNKTLLGLNYYIMTI